MESTENVLASMTLEEHLSSYKNLALAQTSDNEEILHFLKNIPMESAAVSLKYDRAPDFFALLKAQGHRFFVIKFLNKDKSIGGIGVITIRYAWVNGRQGQVAYTSDLRVSPTLYNRARLDWRNYYTDMIRVFKSIDELADVDYFHTAILDDNEQAIRALCNPKSKLKYEKICPYRSVSLYGRLPFNSLKTNYTVSSTPKVSELESFLEQTNKQITGGQFYAQDSDLSELKRRSHNLPDYAPQKYLVIRDSNGKIIACTIPTSNQNMRRIVIHKMNFRYKVLTCLTPLIRGKRLKTGQGLKILYLSDLCFLETLNDQEKSNIVTSFIKYIYKNKLNETYHLITFNDQYNSKMLSTLRKHGHFFETKKGTLFQVRHIDHDEKYLKIDQCNNMSFELALS